VPFETGKNPYFDLKNHFKLTSEIPDFPLDFPNYLGIKNWPEIYRLGAV